MIQKIEMMQLYMQIEYIYKIILNFCEYGMGLFLWQGASVKGKEKQGKDNNSKTH